MSVRRFIKFIVMRHFFLLCFLIVSATLSAQKGTLRGTVLDQENSETLIGAFVTVEGTTTGTVTDLDGNFSLDLPAGTYTIQISYVSYAPLLIENIIIKAGEVDVLNQIPVYYTHLTIPTNRNG